MIFDHSPRLRLSMAVWSAICGGIAIGVASPLAITGVDFYYGFGEAFDAGGGDPTFSYIQKSLFGCIAGGALSMIAMFIGCLGSVLKNRYIYYFFIALSMLGGLVTTVGGGMFTGVGTYVGGAIYYQDTNSINPKLTGVYRDMLDFELAIFNQCCVARNWSAQDYVKPCTGVNDADCPLITDNIVNTQLPNARVLLCSCASSQTALDKFEAGIVSTGFCAKGETVTATISTANNLELPAKAKNLGIHTLVSLQYPQLQFDLIPLVGWSKDLASWPNGNPGQWPFGCGFGYAKGISWFIDVWHQQHIPSVATGGLAIGIVQILGLLTGLCIGYVQKEDELEAQGAPGGWKPRAQDMPASFREIKQPTQMFPLQAQPVVQAEMQGMANAYGHQNQVQVAGYMQREADSFGSSASTVNAQQAQLRADIAAKLREFYAKYDPGKDLADVDDVALWASINGIPALNAKLHGKYGSDLSAISGGGGNFSKGLKALDTDVDI